MVKTNMNSGHTGGERGVCMCKCVIPRHTWAYNLADKKLGDQHLAAVSWVFHGDEEEERTKAKAKTGAEA